MRASLIKLSLPIVLFGVLASSGCSPQKPISKAAAEAECIRNMEIVLGAAESYVLENRKGLDTLVSPLALGEYIKDGRPPRCPLGTNEYPTFIISRGPSCPNNPEHTTAFLKKQCAKDRAMVWDVTISYCREHHLSWDTKIS